jgi:hypothetical protein
MIDTCDLEVGTSARYCGGGGCRRRMCPWPPTAAEDDRQLFSLSLVARADFLWPSSLFVPPWMKHHSHSWLGAPWRMAGMERVVAAAREHEELAVTRCLGGVTNSNPAA